MTDLFRQQAVDHQRQRFHGSIVLTRSPARTAWVVFFVVLIGALLAFAALQGFARKESVGGALMPAGGMLRLVAPQAGVVVGGAAQGQAVAAGEVVVRLSAEQSTGQGSTQQAVAQSLDSRRMALEDELRQQDAQTRQRGQSLDARIANLAAGLQQQERELVLQRQRVQVVSEVAVRYPDLVRSGAVSPVEAAEKSTEVIDQQARLSALERTRLDLQRELATARSERANLPLQAGREDSQLRREMQSLAQQQAENEGHRATAVLAPQAGRVATVLAGPGQAVTAGQVLATLAPAGVALEAELYVPSRAAGFVRPGTLVKLRVDAFPYVRFGQLSGHVREVAQSAVAPVELAAGRDMAALDAAAVYRVRVALDPSPGTDTGTGAGSLDWRRALKPGMQVQASLVAEKRSLLEWVFEPLAGLRVSTR